MNAPPPPVAPTPEPVADRAWLARADRSLRSIRAIVIVACLLSVAVGILAVARTSGASLIVIPGSIAAFLSAEVAFIVARAVVASAWVARKPDGEH